MTYTTVIQYIPNSLGLMASAPRVTCVCWEHYVSLDYYEVGFFFFKEFLSYRSSCNSPAHILGFLCSFYQLKSHFCDRQTLNMVLNALWLCVGHSTLMWTGPCGLLLKPRLWTGLLNQLHDWVIQNWLLSYWQSCSQSFCVSPS